MDPLTAVGPAIQRLREPEDVGVLRRAAQELAVRAGASEEETGKVALVVTELGTNSLRHAHPPGTVLVQPVPAEPGGLEVIAIDRGPGIADLPRALQGRGLSAPGQGLGCGLASVGRLASELHVHSEPGQGTVVVARFRFRGAPPTRFRCGAVSLPVLGEQANGDGWAVACRGSTCTAMVVDGLGHGPEAARAAAAALDVFEREAGPDLDAIVRRANQEMRATRGGALSLCHIDAQAERALFCGLGNVEGRICSGETSVGLAPRHGTAGMNIETPRLAVRELSWTPGSLLVLHSDGIRSQAELGRRHDLRGRDVAVIAGVIHRDGERGRDDATVLVVQDRGR
jgi:anti-sigma regulatory factor (Ser/Thr protein kinase)